MNTTHNEQGSQPERPLGYWLRTVDGLITREFFSAFEDEGVTRRDWMLLSVLSGDVEIPGIAERIARKGKRLRGLADRGWVEEQGDGTWALTDEGRAAKERLGGIVDGLRERVAGAVSPEDFATMTASLEAIARELGGDEIDADQRRGFGRRFGGPGFGHRFGPGSRDFGRGFGAGSRDFGRGFGPRPGFGPDASNDAEGCRGERGHAGHRRGHGHPGERHGGHRHGERAYERGFDAGFARGRTAADA